MCCTARFAYTHVYVERYYRALRIPVSVRELALRILLLKWYSFCLRCECFTALCFRETLTPLFFAIICAFSSCLLCLVFGVSYTEDVTRAILSIVSGGRSTGRYLMMVGTQIVPTYLKPGTLVMYLWCIYQ